jgi:HSP20 family protein
MNTTILTKAAIYKLLTGGTYGLNTEGYSDELSSDDSAYYISIGLPGYKKEDISVEFDDSGISIKANRKKDDSRTYFGGSTMYGEFSRNYTLRDILTEEIGAEFKDGILEIKIPKKPEEKPKKVQVN